MWTEWCRKQRTGLRQLQESYNALFQKTRVFRVYASNLVPGLVQTEGYATSLPTTITEFRDIPNDVPKAVRARLERSQVLHTGTRRFIFVLEEAVLRYQLADSDAMAAQLGHLLTVGALPSVSLGVIPSGTTDRRVWPMEMFHMYDDESVNVELLSARTTVTQPSDIAMYRKAFDELRAMAVYGADARALIAAAIAAPA